MAKQRKVFPWLATLIWGEQYSSFLDAETGGKVHHTFFSGVEMPISNADKARLEDFVMLLPVSKHGIDEYHINSEQVFAQKRVFSFAPNPAFPSAA